MPKPTPSLPPLPPTMINTRWSPTTARWATVLQRATVGRLNPSALSILQRGFGILARLVMAAVLFGLYFLCLVPGTMFRGVADNIGFGVHQHFNLLESIILTDRPNRWLQAAFLHVRVLQLAATATYLSWFLLPVAAALPLIWRLDRRAFQLVGFLVLTFSLAVPLFALYPLAPPWIHDPHITNVVHLVRPGVRGADDNPYASMPSLHVALPAAAALWYGPQHRYRWVLAAYTCLITLTVLYTGDHYLADAVGGVIFASAIYLAVKRLRLPLLYASGDADEFSDRAEPDAVGETLAA